MSTLRISNIEAKSVPASATIDEKVKITNSSGDPLVFIDGKTSGITTVGINTTDGNITFDANSNIVVTGIITATKFVGTIEPTNLTVGGDLTIPDKIIHTGDTNTTIRFPAADTITAETGGSERLRIDSNGYFKVTNGSTSDFNTIQRASTSNYTGIRIQDADATQRMQIGVAGGTNNIVNGAAQHDVVFKSYANLLLATNQTERLRIDSSGRVMLGTTTEGNVNADDLTVATSGEGGITIRTGASSNGNIFFSDATSGAGEYAGIIDYKHGSNVMTFGTSGAERLRIASTGNVSINTTNVTEGVLQVNGDISAGILHGGRMYGLLAKRKFDGNNSLAGFAMEYASGYESPYIVAYNNTSSPSINNITFGSLTASDRNLNTGLTKLVEINANSGNMSLNTGNLVIGTSGKGIDFGATGDAGGMTSELLDDYEEGSWTPALQFDVNGSGLSYGTRAGTYTKIGRKVTVIYYMVVSSGASSSDYFARLTLPFTGASVGHQDCRVRQWNNGYSDWFLSIGGGAPVFFHSNAAGSGANYARGDDVNGYALAGEFTYFI